MLLARVWRARIPAARQREVLEGEDRRHSQARRAPETATGRSGLDRGESVGARCSRGRRAARGGRTTPCPNRAYRAMNLMRADRASGRSGRCVSSTASARPQAIRRRERAQEITRAGVKAVPDLDLVAEA